MVTEIQHCKIIANLHLETIIDIFGVENDIQLLEYHTATGKLLMKYCRKYQNNPQKKSVYIYIYTLFSGGCFDIFDWR